MNQENRFCIYVTFSSADRRGVASQLAGVRWASPGHTGSPKYLRFYSEAQRRPPPGLVNDLARRRTGVRGMNGQIRILL